MPSNDQPGLRFSGHESFPIRYGWIPKGVQGAIADESIFSRSDATVMLGVGKNMVAAIRYWCVATGFIRVTERGARAEPTTLGLKLFGRAGWDPFLEDTGTMWLIHWMLVRDAAPSSTWHIAFTDWNASQFRRDDLVRRLQDVLASYPSVRATKSSLERDVDVFVRSYVPSRDARDASPEDSLDSPLVELGLIHEIDSRIYAFHRGSQPSLPDSIFVFALLDHWDRRYPERSTLSFEAIYRGPGSPAAAFKLTENALTERLENLNPLTGMTFDETAGTRVVMRSHARITTPDAVLDAYYRTGMSGSRDEASIGKGWLE